MNPELVKLALHKQRLQLRCATQRNTLIHHAQGVVPVFRGVDRVIDGVLWVRHKLPVVSALGIVLLVVRPRTTLRWARRGWLAWQFVRRVRQQLV
jgi:hypothetical protein